VAAVALTGALVAYPVLQPVPYRRLLVLFGVVSVFGLVAAVLARWPQLVGWGLAGLLLEYGFSLVGSSGLDVGAPLYAASLLVLGELVASIAGEPVPDGTGRHRFEVSGLTAIALGGAAVSGFVLTTAWLLGRPDAGGQLIGVAAAGIALVILVRLVQRRTSPSL
jgi:hypothetical protein